jgi:hypothetical protein
MANTIFLEFCNIYILSTETKGKAAAVHHQTADETMSNFQVPDDVPIDSKILKKLDKNQTDDNLKKYFDYDSKQKGKYSAKCRICDHIYQRSNGSTGGMTKHLKIDHTQMWEIYDKAKKQIELKKQNRKAPDGSGYKLFKRIRKQFYEQHQL